MTACPTSPPWRLGLLALAATLTACAGLPGAAPQEVDAPPPPQLTTVVSRQGGEAPADAGRDSARVALREGPLAPVPGIDPPAPQRVAEDSGAPLTPGFELQRLPQPGDRAQTLAPNEDESGADAAGKPVDTLGPDEAVDAEKARQDLWQRVREGYGIPDLDGDRVAQHERWYASRPDYVRRMTERGGRYLFHIVQEVEKRGMPTELALLPFIESAFNPQAMSTAKASGMWQFIPSTGRDYDLKQNVFRDDRRDVLASTRAALDYLGRLNAEFDDWQLSLAAYNWGEGNVRRALARNRAAGLPTDYESLRMPAETRNYVPKLQAVKNIVTRPEAYGLDLPELRNHPYFMSVPVRRDIDVALAAQLAGLPVEEFKTLNPSMNKPVILAAGTPQILLPYDNADDFVRRLEAHRGPLASWTAWRVPATMRPAEVAKRVGVAEATLREVNRIPPRMLVKAGSTLLVPRRAQVQTDVPEHVADNAQMALAPDAPKLRKLAVRAKKGDTVASLAQRYRVSAAQLAQWNRIGEKTRLSAGQALVIYQPMAKKAGPARKAAPRRAQAEAGAVRLAGSRP